MNLDQDWLAAASTQGHKPVFMVGELPRMPRGKGIKIINIPSARLKKGEERVAGLAVFQEGNRLLLHAGKGELKLASGEKIDHYVGERAFRELKLPRGHQEVKGIGSTRTLLTWRLLP